MFSFMVCDSRNYIEKQLSFQFGMSQKRTVTCSADALTLLFYFLILSDSQKLAELCNLISSEGS